MNNLVLIEEKNFSDFRVVLPAGINLCPERIIIGCYDDDASILGALSFVMADYEYEIDWLYVIPEARRKEVATTLIRSFFDFMAKTGEIYPVRALFEVTDEDSLLYKFFLSVPEFDVSFSHHRYYVDNKEISASQELKKDLMLQLEEKKFFSLEEKEQLEILHDIDMRLFFADKRRDNGDGLLEDLKNRHFDAWDVYNKLDNMNKQYIKDSLRQLCQSVAMSMNARGIGIEAGRSINNRDVATSRLAQLLGIQNMVCDSRTAYVKSGDHYMTGTIMENTGGKGVSDLYMSNLRKNIPVNYSTNAISQVFVMQMFDVICAQFDRHYANHHAVYEYDAEKKKVVIKGIKCLDNDLSFGKCNYNISKRGPGWGRDVNKVNIMGLPVEFLNNIMRLEKKTIELTLGDLLSEDELDMLWERILGLKGSIGGIDELQYDEDTKWYYYKGEDADDTLRQLKQLKIIKNHSYDPNAITKRFAFHGNILQDQNVNEMINNRKKELGIKVK